MSVVDGDCLMVDTTMIPIQIQTHFKPFYPKWTLLIGIYDKFGLHFRQLRLWQSNYEPVYTMVIAVFKIPLAVSGYS